MRVLVTNAQKIHTYEIIRCLRPHSERIVTAMDHGDRHADYSRHVDARYEVRPPSIPDAAPRNSATDPGYLEDILDICRREKIDTVFPSREPDLYILSKNKSVLEGLDILLVAPDHDVLRIALDKSETIRLAQQIGFPCPNTRVPRCKADVISFADETGPPWVVKPRHTSGSAGLEFARDRTELVEKFEFVNQRYLRPMIQEYVPGKEMQNFYIMADANSGVHNMLCPKIVRYQRRLYRNSTAACLSSSEHPCRAKVEELVRALRLHGAITVQTKVDARDGVLRLMEVNAGVRTHAWYKTGLGINDPLLSVLAAKGATLPEVDAPAKKLLFLDPLEDLAWFVPELTDLLVFRFMTSVLRRQPTDPLCAPPSLREFAWSYVDNYFGAHKRFYSPQFRFFLSDPRPNWEFLLGYTRNAARRMKKAGQWI